MTRLRSRLIAAFLASTLRGEPQTLALRHAAQAATARVTTTGIPLHHAPP